MFLQETYLGSICYTFQVRFICDADYASKRNPVTYTVLVHKRSTLEASNRGSKYGLSKAEQVKCYLRKAEAQVYMITYTRSYNVSARNIPRKHMLHFPSSLHMRCRLRFKAKPSNVYGTSTQAVNSRSFQ